MEEYPEYLKGRGAQINPPNPYLKGDYDTQAEDGLDEALVPDPKTEFIPEHPKKIINKVTSPDVPMDYSINPYQGCEHGCVYCYARNAHTYWGYSAGLDFERKIIYKPEAPKLLKEAFEKKSWKAHPIMLSGNTDCYQPGERNFKLTRGLLEVFLQYKNPVGIVTKNSLILRDLDILCELAKENLVHVFLSVTTLEPELRRLMEPRTATGQKRVEVIRQLSAAGVPTGALLGPIIPGLNNHEIPKLVKTVADAGASAVGYTFIRLNGQIKEIFEHWLRETYPDRADKVLNQIRASHGGKLNDSEYGRRMRGEGEIAESISRLFKLAKKQHMADRAMPAYNLEAFRRPGDGQLSLF
ncbi:MAG: PA0069 family radical SAM protein [Bacteroidota bacterium]